MRRLSPDAAAATPEPATRERLEDSFGTSLRSVELAVARSGPPGRAAGNRVVIAAPWYRPDTPTGLRLLAHEYAHVLQQGRGAADVRRASATAIEWEADAAAAAVVAGRRFHVGLADAPGRVRHWNEAGHYYTSYLVMLAAGADPAVAERMALFCQFPDMVDDLDAYSTGMRWAASKGKKAAVGATIGFFTPIPFGTVIGGYVAGRATTSESEWNTFFVYTGLHSLTGRDAKTETDIRAGVLADSQFGGFKFGLALHPYGDSFAHRVKGGAKMCGFPEGHAPWKHEPDYVDTRPEIYQQYGLGLYTIVRKKVGGDARMLETPLGEKLLEIAKVKTDRANKDEDLAEAAQIARIREVAAADLKVPLTTYSPEKDKPRTTTWEDFQKKHPTFNRHLSEIAMMYAREWATARPN